jgi:type IV pilus assembly protein PilM
MLSLKKERTFIGLDIGSYAVKALELLVRMKNKRPSYEVAKIGYEPLPHEAIVEGAIIDTTVVAEALKALFEKNNFTAKDVVISVSGNSVIIKKISLPVMEAEELAESIIWEAKHNIPYPYEETHVDYAILQPPGGGESRNLEILLVAVKKDKIASYSSVVSQARKNLEAVDVDAFALLNAFEVNYPEEFQEKTCALVNMGAGITTIVICEKSVPQLFRDLAIGGTTFTESLCKDLNIGLSEAETILKGVPSKTAPPYDIEPLVNVSVQSLLDEIEKTFTFFKAENKDEKKIDQIYLSGGLAGLKKIAGAFEQRFQVPTALFDPFRKVVFNERKLDPEYSRSLAPVFGVATGLATRVKEK